MSKEGYERELSDPERMQGKPDLVDLLSLGAPGAIERQEKRGQEAFVNTATLPKELQGNSRSELEALGFKFGEDVDSLFVRAELPEGWRKEATDHAMWSKLIDAKGRERASIFYKAAFYDRRAFMSLTVRYRCGTRPVGGYESPQPHSYEGYVSDCGNDLFVTEPTEPRPPYENREALDRFRKQEDLRQAQAQEWLTSRFPDYRNPLAYWD